MLAFQNGAAYSQDTESIESLSKQVNVTESDSARVLILNQLAIRHIELNQLDKAFGHVNEAFDIASQSQFEEGMARASQTLGLHACYSNRFREAIQFYFFALETFEQIDDAANASRIENEIGGIYHQMTVYDTALIHFNSALDRFKQLEDSIGLSDTYNRIGLVYNSKGEYEAALENFMNSIQISTQIHHPIGMSITYCNMGMVYQNLQEYEKADEFLNRALVLNNQEGPTRDIVEVYLQLGLLNRSIDQHQEAIKMYKKSLNLARYYNDQRIVGECLSRMGSVYHDLKNYTTALSFYKRALIIQENLGINQGVVQTSTSIAGAYLDMVDARRSGTYTDFSVDIVSEANIFQLLYTSINLARESGNYIDLVSSYETLIRASATFRRYDDAVQYQNQLMRYHDSLEGIFRQQNIAQLQADFERKEKEKEIALLNSDRVVQESVMDRQRMGRLFYFGGGLTLIILIIGMYNRLKFINRTRNELQVRNVGIEEEKKRAEQSENVKEQFLAKMSHEIRIPMNTIMGSVNILLNGKHEPDQVEYLNAIYQSSENLMVIINDILDLSKLEAGQIKLESRAFSILEEVKNVEQIMVFRAGEKGIELKIHVDEAMPDFVLGDPTRLNQVLINLAGNGIKFTEKGSVVINALVKDHDGDQVNILFSVADTGIGIPEDRLDKIFKSFTQADSDTNRKYGGTGLGLTISKQLVELQEGKIKVESEFGKGSKFFFELAYTITHKEQAPESIAPKSRFDAIKGLRILAVEDDEFNVMVLKDTLSSSLPGTLVEVAATGTEALQKWSEESYDIILMDIELPEMNGHEVTRAIRSSQKIAATIPIIAMTANAMQADVEACFESGMNDYVAKPFDPEELILKINSNLMEAKKKSDG